MDLLIKTLSQAPLVAVMVWIWWTGRKDSLKEIRRLQERVRDKDDQLGEFAKTFDRLSGTLALIKDRLR